MNSRCFLATKVIIISKRTYCKSFFILTIKIFFHIPEQKLTPDGIMPVTD